MLLTTFSKDCQRPELIFQNHGQTKANMNIIFIRKAFDIHFDTNESDNKLILLERRFDVIFTSFSSSIKVRYFFNCSYDEFVIAQANNYIKSQCHAQLNCGKCTRLYFLLQLS